MIDDPKVPLTPSQEPQSGSLPIDPSLTMYLEEGQKLGGGLVQAGNIKRI